VPPIRQANEFAIDLHIGHAIGMADADTALPNLRVIGIEVDPDLTSPTRLDGGDLDHGCRGFDDGVVASGIAHLHQAFGRQAYLDLAYLHVTCVAQLDEQAGAVVHQPGLERFGKQLGIGCLGQIDQPIHLLLVQRTLGDAVDARLQALVFELLVGLADALAELAWVGEIGVGQGSLKACVALERHIGHQHDHQAKQQGYEEFPDFVPTQRCVPSVTACTVQGPQRVPS